MIGRWAALRLAVAAHPPMTEEQRTRQIESLARGNLALVNAIDGEKGP